MSAELAGMETSEKLIGNVFRVSMDRERRIRQLEAQNHELVRKIARLRMEARVMKRALHYYADVRNIRDIPMLDIGAKAREALK